MHTNTKNKLKGFVQYFPPDNTRGKTNSISKLQIGQSYCIIGKTEKDLRLRMYSMKKRTGKTFAFLECVNGIVVKRCA